MNNQKDAEQAKRAQAIRSLVDNFNPTHTSELFKMIATERKIKFDAHVNAGFSESQALTLCKE